MNRIARSLYLNCCENPSAFHEFLVRHGHYCPVELANYRTAWQESLDLNQPPGAVTAAKQRLEIAQEKLFAALP